MISLTVPSLLFPSPATPLTTDDASASIHPAPGTEEDPEDPPGAAADPEGAPGGFGPAVAMLFGETFVFWLRFFWTIAAVATKF